MHFITSYCTEQTPYGTMSMIPSAKEWIETIPYGKPFRINTISMDGGASWEFTFNINGKPAKTADAIPTSDTSLFLDLFEIGWSAAEGTAIPVKTKNDVFVHVGGVFRGSHSGCAWELTVLNIANTDDGYNDKAITLQFQTSGVVKAGKDGKAYDSNLHSWTETILLRDGAYHIATQEQGMTWEFRFF